MQQKERHLIGVVKQRLDPIEYRPHVHHRMHLVDDTFDLKFSAFLWFQSLIQAIKRKIFDQFAERNEKKLVDLTATLSKNAFESVQVIHLRSCKMKWYALESRDSVSFKSFFCSYLYI
jgi:hypothetical protein